MCGVAGGSSTLRVGIDTVGTPGAITSSAIGTGTLTFDGGTLQAGGNYTVANTGQINSTGGAIDTNGFTFTYSGDISDAPANVGGLTIKDSTGTTGVVVLSGNNRYSRRTDVDSGTLQAGAETGRAQNSAFAVNLGATLDLNGFVSTIGSQIDGAGGGGSVNNSSATAATLTAGGDNTSTGFRRQHPECRRRADADQDRQRHHDAVRQEFEGTGTTILTGDSTYTGFTTICAWTTLQLGDGGTTGSIVGDVINDGALAFKRSDSASTPYVFAGVISGDGVVKQIGSGAVELSGANTYSGGTVISGGTVRVTISDPGTSSSVGTGAVTLDGGKFQAGANNLDFSNAFEVNTTGRHDRYQRQYADRFRHHR